MWLTIFVLVINVVGFILTIRTLLFWFLNIKNDYFYFVISNLFFTVFIIVFASVSLGGVL